MRMILLPNRELLQVYLLGDTGNSFNMRPEQHWESKVVQTGTSLPFLSRKFVSIRLFRGFKAQAVLRTPIVPSAGRFLDAD